MHPAEKSPRPSRTLFWVANALFLALLACLLLLPRLYERTHQAAAAPSDGYAYHGQALPPGRPAADFTLTDQDAHPFTLQSQRGKLVLLFFGFTHCPNICPTTLANAASMLRQLTPEEQQRIQVLFISVDPDRDTPAALKAYVPFFDPRFIGLTGTPEQIAQVARAYGVVYEKAMQASQSAGNQYTINHSIYTYLINPAGEFAVLYDDKEMRDARGMVADLRHILALSPR